MSKLPEPPKDLRISGDAETPEVISSENFPQIGDMVTTEQALALCRDFGLDYLVERIECDPDKYKEWEFDGCSGLPDELMGLFTGCDWKDITFKCCLPHDLGYGYGEPGNEAERKTDYYSHQLNLTFIGQAWFISFQQMDK